MKISHKVVKSSSHLYSYNKFSNIQTQYKALFKLNYLNYLKYIQNTFKH